jgi:hypothetical protein
LHRFVAPVHDTVNIRKESKDDEIPFLLYDEQAKLLRTIYLFIFGGFFPKKRNKGTKLLAYHDGRYATRPP